MKKKVLKRLLIYVKPYWGFLFGILLSALINISLTLYAPILIGQAVDHIIGFQNVDHQGMIGTLIVLTGIILLSALFQWVLSHCTNEVAYRTVRDLRVDAYGKINTLPLKYIDGHSHGDVISRIVNDVEQVSEGLLQGITQFFTGIVTIIGTLIFMFTISPIIMLVVVLVTPLSLFVASFIAKFSHKMFVQQQAAQGELSGYIEELISNQKIVKTFRYEKRAQEQFEEINHRLQKVGAKAQFLSSLSNPSTRFVNGVVYAAVAIFGSLCAITGWPTVLTIGQISSFLTYANQYTKPFNEITGVITQVQTAFASAERLFEFLDEEEETADTEDAVVIEKCEGNVEIRDVSFSYEPGTTLLEHMNVSAKKGDRIAIVGPTGCGKTTIINLLLRFYDVQSGQITIDGVDIRTMTRGSLRSLYGMVLQDTWLFAGTVRENIMYGKPDATEEELIQAAKAAYADAFIQRLPNGYDTVIAEDGGNLSQGQRQLLSIARVMLVDPPMLILDEATSSIDTRTELKVQAAFQNMMEGRTSFIVAHRLSTIKEATTILVMEKGRMLEQGTHSQLLQKGGFYANLYNSQFAATE
ncbi:MAG: ABC transporter ATP-binding protein [Clostridiales bacterium]|jgi:ATP-binding cassette subfamily B multidrug efflux pump|nr:ABC transporter ATP-binding protein [Clostridiales bacterium]